MELAALIDALSDPAAYPHPVEAVAVHQTHISAVFLAGPFAYKIKKPVNLGFLDFSTLEKRRHFCDEEVRLNRRLAPTVYHGVVPISRSGSGVKVEGAGEPIEWAVKMERLPEEATLQKRLQRGEVSVDGPVQVGCDPIDERFEHCVRQSERNDFRRQRLRYGVLRFAGRHPLIRASAATVTVAFGNFSGSRLRFSEGALPAKPQAASRIDAQ